MQPCERHACHVGHMDQRWYMLLWARSASWQVCGSAAGALQNLSREVASRNLIRKHDAVHALTIILAAPDIQVHSMLPLIPLSLAS